ncbi:MAG: YceI family protein [Gammaproteobacteria bacterium]|nr:YceI family protein [Gammaproteobacteria bacterium]
MRIVILLSLVIFLPFVSSLQAAEDDGKICAPFRGGIVDPAIINSMLQASDEGSLYRIQPKNSKVGFCVNSAIGRVEARFQGIEGGFALRKEVWGDKSQMLVMLDTNSLEMEGDYLKDMIKGEYFLDTYTYSKILFVSTRFWWQSRDKAILAGMLTMHGVTKPVFFNVEIATVPNQNPQSIADIVVTAKSFINRTDFEINNMTFLVSDTVELCMHVQASLFKK